MTHNLILKDKLGTTLGMCTRRILATYRQATRSDLDYGRRWYADGHDHVIDIARMGGISVERAAIIVAHMSPRTPWSANLTGARSLVTTRTAPGCMGGNIDRALRAMDAEDPWSTFTPTARKIHRFARNLLGDTSVITVDVWAVRIATGRGYGAKLRQGDQVETLLSRTGVYDAVERAYLNAAKIIGETGTVVQAATWIVARGGRHN